MGSARDFVRDSAVNWKPVMILKQLARWDMQVCRRESKSGKIILQSLETLDVVRGSVGKERVAVVESRVYERASKKFRILL